MSEVVIVSAARTAIGSFNGALSPCTAVDLGAVVVKAALERAGIAPNAPCEVILGNVLQAGQGQNPARQAMIKAGMPVEIPAYTINKVCGSGLRTVSLAAQTIKAGDASIIVAGGLESMTNCPYVLPKARQGLRMGDATLIDEMVYTGLTDVFNKYHMGITAENVAEKYGITREMQDECALASQTKALAAIKSGAFKAEIVPVVIQDRKGEKIFDTDEYPRESTMDSLAKLKPAFKKDGTVTAGNASGINDGAAALVVMSAAKAKELGLKPLARIAGYGSGGVDPSIMGVGPVPAVKKALEKAGWKVGDLDLIEANEAFASQFLAVGKELGFDPSKVNVNGGAIALGHPIGASGARILTTLLYALKARNGKKGLATLCIGGGMGTALLVEMM